MENNKVEVKISWWIPWIAGALFTFGIYTVFMPKETDVWTIFGFMGIDFILWPFFLGVWIGDRFA